MVPTVSAYMTYKDLFSYELSSNKYSEWNNAFASVPQNFWQIGGDLERYTNLVFWSFASLTTIISLFGRLSDVNKMVWDSGLDALNFVSLLSTLISLYAYNLVYEAYSQDNSGNDATIAGYIAAAESIKSDMELDMVSKAANKGLVMTMLYTQQENYLAVLMALESFTASSDAQEEAK